MGDQEKRLDSLEREHNNVEMKKVLFKWIVKLCGRHLCVSHSTIRMQASLLMKISKPVGAGLTNLWSDIRSPFDWKQLSAKLYKVTIYQTYWGSSCITDHRRSITSTAPTAYLPLMRPLVGRTCHLTSLLIQPVHVSLLKKQVVMRRIIS